MIRPCSPHELAAAASKNRQGSTICATVHTASAICLSAPSVSCLTHLKQILLVLHSRQCPPIACSRLAAPKSAAPALCGQDHRAHRARAREIVVENIFWLKFFARALCFGEGCGLVRRVLFSSDVGGHSCEGPPLNPPAPSSRHSSLYGVDRAHPLIAPGPLNMLDIILRDHAAQGLSCGGINLRVGGER